MIPLHATKGRGYPRVDHSGLRLGTFTAIQPVGLTDQPSYRKVVWLFRCDCGREKTLSTNQIAERLRCGYAPRCECTPAKQPLGVQEHRSKRKREVRARTISTKRMTKRELEFGRRMYPDEGGDGRPRTRGDCSGGHRPCPFVSCRNHLFLDVSPVTGAIKLNFPDLEPDELGETCALDVADRGGVQLEKVGELLNVTRERVRQLEAVALAKMAKRGKLLREFSSEGDDGRRRLPVLQGGE